jgi:hypothetical protein
MGLHVRKALHERRGEAKIRNAQVGGDPGRRLVMGDRADGQLRPDRFLEELRTLDQDEIPVLPRADSEEPFERRIVAS